MRLPPSSLQTGKHIVYVVYISLDMSLQAAEVNSLLVSAEMAGVGTVGVTWAFEAMFARSKEEDCRFKVH
jgi:hypothetical protein